MSPPPPTSPQEETAYPQGRVAATAIIWGCSTGMLTLDLVLTTLDQSKTVIAIAIVTAAAISTMTVWLATGRTSPKPPATQKHE